MSVTRNYPPRFTPPAELPGARAAATKLAALAETAERRTRETAAVAASRIGGDIETVLANAERIRAYIAGEPTGRPQFVPDWSDALP